MVASTLKVLAIEDDLDTRANLRDILELDGHYVESVATVAEAIARENWSQFSAIILDRCLPDGTADDLLPRLRLLAPEAAVIIVTGYADLDGTIAALREGAADYILKPINPDALRASLSRIARIKRAEQQAVQAERLAVIGQMMTVLAHESRNALQRSQACLEMLSLELQDKPDLLSMVGDIQRSQDRLHLLFEDIRGYAAPITLNRELADLGEVLDEAWGYALQQHRERTARMRPGPQGFDLRCSVDRFRIEQVFRNIFENSLAACANPVEIDVLCCDTVINGFPVIQLRFHDNGPGFAPEHRKCVFRPFFTTKSDGTGLGMAISKRIIEAHGGQIELGTSTHPGAELVITLPRTA